MVGALKVGWIGLGAMGAPMARRAATAGFDVIAYDKDATRLFAVVSSTGPPSVMHAAGTAGEAVRDADVAALMVATPEQAEDVLFSPDGVERSLSPGAFVLVMATVGPDAISAWVPRLGQRGLTLVDAPVSGGTARAESGELLAMVGGAEAAVGTVTPLLGALASTTVVVGAEPGDGQRMKLVNQLLCGVHIAVAAEALAFAEALGLDPRQCWEVLRHGAADSFMFEDRGARMLEENFEPPRSALDIFVKDMALVRGAARQAGSPTPLAEAAEQIYLAGQRAGLGRLDDSVVIEVARGAK
ncbi:MAG TPA: NAD(P)-dependent oxidoreductase [Acidimicrobiales bacterium]|nr:NAD(P)-dependent oxidoreductase [Acidimicrobiales bacterium]